MLKMFVTVDKNQHFKFFITDTTAIRLEYSSNNAEISFVSNFKQMTVSSNWITMFSAV